MNADHEKAPSNVSEQTAPRSAASDQPSSAGSMPNRAASLDDASDQPSSASSASNSATAANAAPNRTRPVLNRVIFALLTLVLGGLAGAFVWVFFFLLNHGINLFWHVLPEHIGAWWWPLAVCLVGGVAKI